MKSRTIEMNESNLSQPPWEWEPEFRLRALVHYKMHILAFLEDGWKPHLLDELDRLNIEIAIAKKSLNS